MNSSTPSFRSAKSPQLAEALRDARQHTLDLFDCFQAAGLDVCARVPRLATLNPPLWELGHLAWFAEWYVLREAETSHPAAAQRHSLLTRGDDWFDANTVPWQNRWTLDLPSSGALKTYCHEVLDRTLDKLERAASSDAALYPYRLALAHEDLRGEAMLCALQSLGIAAPASLRASQASISVGRTVAYPGGSVQQGSAAGSGFTFDNERAAHPVYVAPFQVDAVLVSNAQFADFVRDGGYQRPSFWSKAGSAWLMRQERSAPRYWQRDGEQWRSARFGRAQTLSGSEPVRHVNLYEAQAYCLWAGRRLPSEAEWEYAALSRQPGFEWGRLWEWTASPFEPYPGFAADGWRAYSEPHFMSHQVLRGASFATPARFASARFRQFHLPERDDIFAGFRTCAWD